MVDTPVRSDVQQRADPGSARPMPMGAPGGFRPLSSDAKLLSHRARGFGYREATPDAVRAAVRSGIRHIELDTRISADGVICAHHGTRVFTGAAMPKVRSLAADALAAAGIAPLAELLGILADTLDASQTLCLDIKDFGFESQHVALVEQFGLAAQTVFVSWIPHVLARLHAIAPRFKLILSQLNLQCLPFGAGAVEALVGPGEMRVLDYAVIGTQAIERPLQSSVGFQHALASRTLPEPFMRILQESGGGICVPTFCVCDQLDTWCTRQAIQQWVFTENRADAYERLHARPAVQVIFSDDPLRVKDVLF